MRASLDPATRWSTRTPSRRPGAGLELGHDADQVVYATEVLDDDALDAQVLTPHLRDEFGVVAALDIDPAGAGDPGAAPGTATEPDAVRAAAAGAARRGAVRITGRPSNR